MVSSTTLFVSNLPLDTTAKALADLFSPFGSLLKVEIPAPKQADPSFLFGFVDFSKAEDASVAQREMNASPFKGLNLRVKHATSTKAPGNSDVSQRRSPTKDPRQGHRQDRYRVEDRDRRHDNPRVDESLRDRRRSKDYSYHHGYARSGGRRQSYREAPDHS